MLSVLKKEVWPLCLSVSVKKAWPLPGGLNGGALAYVSLSFGEGGVVSVAVSLCDGGVVLLKADIKSYYNELHLNQFYIYICFLFQMYLSQIEMRCHI